MKISITAGEKSYSIYLKDNIFTYIESVSVAFNFVSSNFLSMIFVSRFHHKLTFFDVFWIEREDSLVLRVEMGCLIHTYIGCVGYNTC